jgi:hypothetical protein
MGKKYLKTYCLLVNLTNALNSCCSDAIRSLVQLQPGLDKPNWIGGRASNKTCWAKKGLVKSMSVMHVLMPGLGVKRMLHPYYTRYKQM